MRFQQEYALSEYDAAVLTQSKHLAELFEETARISETPKKVANWFTGEVFRQIKHKELAAEDVTFTPRHLADLIVAVEHKEISQTNAKEVFEKIMDENVEPLAYMKQAGLTIVTDDNAVEAAVDEVLKGNQKVVEEYLGGKEKVLGFLVGNVMKTMKGKADATKVSELIKEKIK